MNKLFLPIGPTCFVCGIPPTIKCSCNGEPNIFYLCEAHGLDHLEREGEHPMELFDYIQTDKFPIEVDEETLEKLNFSLSGHKRPITSIALTRKFLVSGEKDGIYKWDPKTKALLSRILTNNQVWSVAVYFNLVAAGLDNCSVLVYDINTNEQKLIHKQHANEVLVVKFTFSGDYVISGCSKGFQVVYSSTNNELYSKDNIHSDAILCMAISPDSKFVVTGCKTGAVIAWNFDKKMTHYKVEDETQAISAVCFLDRYIFAYGGFSGIIRFWDINENKKSITDIVQPKRKIVSFVASNDGVQLYTSDSNNRLSKYKIEKDNSILEQFIENQNYIIGLTLCQENRYLYAISGGITVHVFDTTDLITLCKVIGHDKLVAVKRTLDKNYIVAVYMDGGISFFELNSGFMAFDFENFYEARNMLGKYPELGVNFDPDEF